MSAKKTMLAAAVGTLFALTAAQATLAADNDANSEKCYGIAKAGKNDCAGAKHACAGQGTAAQSANDWVKLPKGTCERIVGGSLVAPAATKK
jgi:uncharacterized membrane protein